MSADQALGTGAPGTLAASPRRGRGAARHTARTVGVLLLVLGIATAGFFLLDLRGDLEYALTLRGRRYAALVVVGAAIAISTVVFQTITENRILTPSIMGFDSVFVLVQTAAVFTLGGAALAAVPTVPAFVAQVLVMLAFSVPLFRWIFGGARRSLYLLLLVGIVIGSLFRSLSALLQRIIDPNEFYVLQARLFASFNTVDSTLLGVTAVLVGLVLAGLWRIRRDLDVLALGRDVATNLGVDHRRRVMQVLVAVAVLVSASTALVGPVTFFGLLVANVTYWALRTARHAVVLPVSVLVAVVTLVLGQTILDRLLGVPTVLSVVIEMLGGIVLIVMILRGVGARAVGR